MKSNTSINQAQYTEVNGLVVLDMVMVKFNSQMVLIMKANGILEELMAKVLSNGRSQEIFIMVIGMQIFLMVMVNLKRMMVLIIRVIGKKV